MTNRYQSPLSLSLVAAIVAAVLSAPGAAPSVAAADGACATSSTIIEEPSWGQVRMGAERVWDRTRGDGVTIAVIDSGVGAAAPSLNGAVLPGHSLNGAPATDDCYGRGTFIASLAAGRAVSDTDVMGLAPGATILPIRISDEPDSLGTKPEAPGLIADAVRAASGSGASIIVVAPGTPNGTPDLQAAVQEAQARGALVIASAVAAGGSGRRPPPTFPAAWDGVLAVAPLLPTGADTSTQLGTDPDLAAPSSDLIGASPAGGGFSRGADPRLALGYVAGAAALVRADRPDLTAAQVAERLIDTTDRPTSVAGLGGRDAAIGSGVVNPIAAIGNLGPEEVNVGAEFVPVEITPPPKESLSGVALIGAIILGSLILALMVIGPMVGTASHRRPAHVTAEATAAARVTAEAEAGAGATKAEEPSPHAGGPRVVEAARASGTEAVKEASARESLSQRG